MPANVMIATPTLDGLVCVEYMNAILGLVAASAETGEAAFSTPYFARGSLINKSRNSMASLMLESPQYTHLLFVDSDIGFAPRAVRRMLDFDRPITACAYTNRQLDPERSHAVARLIDDPLLAARVAQTYVAADMLMSTPAGDGQASLQVRQGFARTRRVGMGLTLIRRDALETMRAAYPDLSRPPDPYYRRMGVRHAVFQCFETLVDKDGLYLGEDISFCDRWTEGCGGEIWVNIDEELTHTGPATFSGRLIDRLQHGGPLA